MNQIDDHIPPLAAPVGCVLVVDDEEKSRRLLHDLLEVQGYKVIIAVDGEDGLRKAYRNHPISFCSTS